MPVLTVTGGTLHYRYDESAGINAPLLVLLHAVGLNGTWWNAYHKHYKGRFRVASVDLLGHGKSSRLQIHWTLEDHARIIAQLISHLGGSAHVVGLSMGGMIAQELAIHYPDNVGSLVLLSTVASLDDNTRPLVAARGMKALTDGIKSIVNETVDRWAQRGVTDDAFRHRCADQLMQNDAFSWMTSWQAISAVNTLANLRQIRCRVLVGVGDLDLSTPVAAATAIASQIHGAQLFTVKGAGHLGSLYGTIDFIGPIDNFLLPMC